MIYEIIGFLLLLCSPYTTTIMHNNNNKLPSQERSGGIHFSDILFLSFSILNPKLSGLIGQVQHQKLEIMDTHPLLFFELLCNLFLGYLILYNADNLSIK